MLDDLPGINSQSVAQLGSEQNRVYFSVILSSFSELGKE